MDLCIAHFRIFYNHFAHGRMAPSLLPGCFGFFENMLRIFNPAFGGIEPKSRQRRDTGTD